MFRTKVWFQTSRYEPVLDESNEPITGEDGNIIYELAQENPWVHNSLIFPGRELLGYMITGLASGGFLWVAAGSTSTAIDTELDDRLGGYDGSSPAAFEYINNGTRKLLQSTLYGGNLTTADWVAEDYTDGLGNVYRLKCQAQVTYGPGDANGTAGGVPLQRYGLCVHSACPGTVTGYSGVMLNEMIDSVAQTLTTTNQIIVKFILRI